VVIGDRWSVSSSAETTVHRPPSTDHRSLITVHQSPFTNHR